MCVGWCARRIFLLFWIERKRARRKKEEREEVNKLDSSKKRLSDLLKERDMHRPPSRYSVLNIFQNVWSFYSTKIERNSIYHMHGDSIHKIILP